MGKKVWTDDQMATLRQMHAAGHLHEEIAARIGMTRAAVTAKVKRLVDTVLVRRRKPRELWTDEKIVEMKRLLARGLTRQAIADEMGISRGAISGKLDRLGLFSSGSRISATPRLRKTRASPIPPSPPVPPACRPVSIMDRANSQCAYPVADFAGPHSPFFCGAAIDVVEPIQSYCAWHRAIAMPAENQPRNRR